MCPFPAGCSDRSAQISNVKAKLSHDRLSTIEASVGSMQVGDDARVFVGDKVAV